MPYSAAVEASANANELIRVVNVGEPVGALALTPEPGVLAVAAKRGFGLLDLRPFSFSSTVASLQNPGAATIEYKKVVHKSDRDVEQLRFNDGYVDARGRFFAGSMAE